MLLKLLSLPVTGPLKIAQIVAEEADSRLYSQKSIFRDFAELRRARSEGEIDEETYEERLAAVNERWEVARERIKQQHGSRGDADDGT